MYRLSADPFYTAVLVSAVVSVEQILLKGTTEMITPAVGQYVAAIYDAEWYVGMVTERSEDTAMSQLTLCPGTSTQTSSHGHLVKMNAQV